MKDKLGGIDGLAARQDEARRQFTLDAVARAAARSKDPSTQAIGKAARKESAAVEAELQALADLPPVEFDRRREDEAKRLKIRMRVLDAEVEKRRAKALRAAQVRADAEKKEQRASLAPMRPEEAAALLDDVHAFLGRFISYSSEHAHVAHTLWIAHTHMMDVWDVTPRLAVLSPDPSSGKTRVLEATELLVPRPVMAMNVTPAYVVRKIGSPDGLPTILHDEIDAIFGPKASNNEDVRAVMNAGYRRGAIAGRCVVTDKGVETEELPAYCAVALAGLGDLPETIWTRCIPIAMRPRAPNETVEPFRKRLVAPEAEPLRERLMAWGEAVSLRGIETWPEMPVSVTDRNAECWEALLKVADLAGKTWAERARVTAVTLVTLLRDGVLSLGVQLLRDMRIVFAEAETKSTETILEALTALEESPWGDLKGKPLTDRGLARRLRRYGIRPKVFRFGQTTARGYDKADFKDAWSRYLPTLQETPPSPEA